MVLKLHRAISIRDPQYTLEGMVEMKRTFLQ